MGTIEKEVGDTAFKGGHNDIRKTNYDVNIVDGKLDLHTHKKVITESKLNESMTILEFDDTFRELYDWISKNSAYMGDKTRSDLKKAIKFIDIARKNEADEHGANYKNQSV